MYPSVAYDSYGNPVISYYHADKGEIWWVHTSKYSYETVNLPVAKTAGTLSTSLVLDKSDNPHISYGNGYFFGDLMYTTWDGTDWKTPEKVDTGRALTGDVGEESRIALMSDDIPVICYMSYDGWNHIQCKKKNKYTYGEWSSVFTGSKNQILMGGLVFTPDTQGNSVPKLASYDVSSGRIELTDIANNRADLSYDAGTSVLSLKGYVDRMNQTHFVYNDDGSLTYLKPEKGMWSPIVIDRDARTSGQFDFTIARWSGDLHVAYWDSKNGMLKYARINKDGEMTSHIVREGIRDDPTPALALEYGNSPAIYFYDSSHNGELVIARPSYY